MAGNVPKFINTHKPDPGSSENMKQGKYQNICTDIIFKLQKIKDKEKNLERSQR